jgi:hypothetical protein
LEITHQERGICVVSGPWGIGKTTAVDLFAGDKAGACVVIKVEQGSTKRGASPVSVLQQSLEAIRPHIGRSPRASLSNAYWSLRQMIFNSLTEWLAQNQPTAAHDEPPLLTLIYDEAQYLSREAIEMLRYWNDPDRTITPFPVGLTFIGNSEFALQENESGQSALSGAVRSRALFVEALNYDDVTPSDIGAFMQSLGPYEPEAISLIVNYFEQRRVRRDMRNMANLDAGFQRRSGGAAVTADIVRAVLS